MIPFLVSMYERLQLLGLPFVSNICACVHTYGKEQKINNRLQQQQQWWRRRRDDWLIDDDEEEIYFLFVVNAV